LKRIISILAVLLTIYQITIGYIGVPPSLKHRPFSVAIILLILFLTVGVKGEKDKGVKWYDYIFGLLTIFSCIFVIFNYDWFLTRFAFLTEVKKMELICGTIFLFLVLEAGRRTVGLVLPCISILTILYALFGDILPGPLHHNGYTFSNVIEQLYMTTEGIWGIPTHAATTFVFMFVIFGEILGITGMGQFFTDLAMALTGRFTGGPAKTAIISSALMGMIQGSSISNVVTTGTFTIPMMKKYGFKDYYAGAVEAVASSGGQITPPIMGAAAFIMADLTGIPYIQIAKHALIPAILYYICVFTQVHLRAKKNGLKGLPSKELPNLWGVLRKRSVFLIPIILIVALMMQGYTPMRAGFISIITVIIIALFIIPEKKKFFSNLLYAFDSAPRSMITVVAAVLNAGIIIGILFMTGLGLRLSSLVVDASQGILLLGLLLTMFLAIILGMGMPTSGAYIIMGTLLAPGLEKMGISTIQAHMFVLYFAAMSMITPPVAVASYAAAGIAGANPQKVGFAAWKLGIAAFIVPYMFAYGSELMLIGGTGKLILPIVTSIIGCFCLACSLEGYLLRNMNKLERVVFLFIALLLIKPGFLTDLIGVSIALIVLSNQIFKKSRKTKEY